MFKRLKDKITEEVKISPSKFSASVQQWQQMAQAVVSPNANSVIDAPSMDSFSIDGEYDETPQNSPAHGSSRASDRSIPTKFSAGDPSTFTLVDLQESSPTPVSGYASSRRSSFASTTSDSPAILFPVLETGTANHFQSDLESCSERDESIFSSNVDNVSKEQLLSAFRKTQQRYHKYKGRYTDLIRHYRELERENTKARTVLAECQDKALRRAAELKEQYQLEQKAKAHLEEVLRSDLEEKDHLIHTLETKIQLLKSGVDPSKVLSAAAASAAGGDASAVEEAESLTSEEPRNCTKRPNALSEAEVQAKLKEKVKKLEGLVLKCKDVIDSKQKFIGQLLEEKKCIEDREAELQNKLKKLQLQEEETSLSVAENKLMVHQELESKEEVIRQLNKQLTSANLRSSDLQKEIEQLQEGFKKDLAAGKQEASRLIQAEMQQIVLANRKLEELLATRDQQLSEHEASLSSVNLRLQELQDELESVRENKKFETSNELSTLQATVAELELALERSDLSIRLEPVLRPLREIRVSAQQLRGELTESLKATKSYVEDSVQNIHSRSAQLFADSKEELDRLREKHESSESQVQDLRGKIQEIEVRLKEKEGAVTSLESELAMERESKSELKKTVEELKKQVDCGAKEYEESKRSLEDQLEQSQLAVQEYKNELDQVREGLLSAENSEKKFIEELQQKIKAKEVDIETLRKDSKLLEEQLEKWRSAMEELIVKANCLPSLEAQIASLKADNAQLLEDKTNVVNNKNKEILDLEETIASRSSEIDALKVDKKKLSEEIGRLEDVMVENETIQISEMQKFETHLNGKNAENEELRNTLNNLQASFNLFKEEHAVISKKLEKSEEKCNEWKSAVEAANAQVCEKQLLLSELEAQITSLSSCSSELTVLKEENDKLSEKVALLESRLRHSSEELHEKEGLMEEKQVELGNLLNLKTQELQELREELDLCKTELSNQTNVLELKTREYEALVAQSSAYADEFNTKSKELLEKIGECEELASQNALIKSELEKEKDHVKSVLEELTATKETDEALIRSLNEKLNAAVHAETELKRLSEEHADQAQLLKLKTDECAEKEAQLDNLADEMKRVDELSQELGRISDESEANVQVLSAEASSLAQKVEELTAKTQQMKEREVELVAKAQMADACQAEFIQLKEAKAELQAKLARAEEAESQLARLKDAQDDLGNRLKQAEEFEKQYQHLKEVASKVPEFEKKCAQLKEAQDRVVVLEEKCIRLAEEYAKLEGAELKVTQLEAECRELRELSGRYADLKKERDHLIGENSNLTLVKEQCVALKTENEKIAELSKECAELREYKSLAEELKIRTDEFEEQLKKSSDLESELEKLREETSELRKLRVDHKNLLGVEEKLKHVQEECERLKEECSKIIEVEAECKALRDENVRIHELEEECERLRNVKQQLETLEKIRLKDGQENLLEDEKLDDKRSLRNVEVECENLRRQLKAAKTEIDDLRSDLEFVSSVPLNRPMSPTKEQSITSLVSALDDDNSAQVPVVEEPMIAKKVKDLYKSSKVRGDQDDDDEDDDGDRTPKIKQNWKEAYESLLQEHKASIESNQQIIEDLKGQLKLREDKPRRKPWERKDQDNTHFASLESKAMNTEGNSVGSAERLQHQIAGLQTQLKDSKRQHRQEVSELRRMLLNNSHGASHGACTLEDATELEYLRNILFEYMMGKEPMVLARVIAAVVKFDSDQTKKVLQKEEQRLTLLGHLGIS